MAEKAAAQARESLRLIRLRYESGLTILSDRPNAEDATKNAELSRVAALFDTYLTQAGLTLALGTISGPVAEGGKRRGDPAGRPHSCLPALWASNDKDHRNCDHQNPDAPTTDGLLGCRAMIIPKAAPIFYYHLHQGTEMLVGQSGSRGTVQLNETGAAGGVHMATNRNGASGYRPGTPM